MSVVVSTATETKLDIVIHESSRTCLSSVLQEDNEVRQMEIIGIWLRNLVARARLGEFEPLPHPVPES